MALSSHNKTIPNWTEALAQKMSSGRWEIRAKYSNVSDFFFDF